MNNKLKKLKSFHRFLLNQISDLTVEQLNKIPSGYNNNIIWNLAHLTCAVQSMCYVRAGLPITVADQYFAPYLPGTKPEQFLDKLTIEAIKAVFLTSLTQLESDLADNCFANYTSSAWTPKVYGVEVTTIEDALEFLLYHAGFHTGYILALKRLVQG